MTLYDVKPRFQAMLRPFVKGIAGTKIRANHITLMAALGSLALGVLLYRYSSMTRLFLLLPLWMFFRMVLNAIDGMLAREFDQKSDVGAYLNELCDVVSDTALYLPFAVIQPFSVLSVGLIIFLSCLSEMAGILGVTVGASRRYDGPMGKSDRAFIFGALGAWIGVGGGRPEWLYWLMPLLALAVIFTIYNRISRALQEIE